MSTDGSAFRNIEERWTIFKEEPRNVRLSLATDGVNPFGELSSIYSVWPIFVINNKIPPWMSIKRENTMLAMIVEVFVYNVCLNVAPFLLSYSLNYFLYICKVVIMCTFNQLGKYQVKYMNVYIEPLIDKIQNLWDGITVYNVSRPIGKKQFQFHGILTWEIHDALWLTHFFGM
jgi:hypothetical protein